MKPESHVWWVCEWCKTKYLHTIQCFECEKKHVEMFKRLGIFS